MFPAKVGAARRPEPQRESAVAPQDQRPLAAGKERQDAEGQMTLLVQPRLVNEPFSDATLLLDFNFGSRAILFDLGDLSPLSSREILRVGHVFVSHMHLDHFTGFDLLLRLNLNRDRKVTLVGPPGLCDAVGAKLAAYTWNLLGERSPDFVIEALDWMPSGFAKHRIFRARRAFRPEEAEPPATRGNFVLDDSEFRIEAAALDHGIPSLAFALQERVRVNVVKERLDALGLPVGQWLTAAKSAMRRGEPPETAFAVGEDLQVTLEELTKAGALHAATGQRVAYATDFAFSEANVTRVVELARGANELFIEAPFLDSDRDLAAARRHLTAAQAGRIARQAGVARATPMHFSPRYLEREDELRSEFSAAFAGES
jgi:ribonuclease Z